MRQVNFSFTFPPIYSINQKFGKNIIIQLILPENQQTVIPTIFQLQNKQYNVLHDENGEKYVLTNKSTDVQISSFDKILYGKFKDILDVETNKSIEYKWVKHPQLTKMNDLQIEEKVIEASNTWGNVFSFKIENIDNKEIGLRNPQLGAICSILSHWTKSDDLATIVMPTGTGKTEVMLSILTLGKCKKLLVTVPTDALREQISNKFITLGILRKLGLLENSVQNPVVGILNSHFKELEDAKSFFKKCNVVISTMTIMSNCNNDMNELVKKSFSNLFIDEAHHSEATSWHKFRNSFLPNKIIQFTATPFRNDGKRLDGEIIYNFPLKRAQDEKYFTKINFIEVTEYDPDLADKSIVTAAVNKLKEDLEQGLDHILMARVSSKKRAQDVFEHYNHFPEYNPVIIHTGINLKRRNELKRQIIDRTSKIVICVDMLGEGFDLPNLKIAAFHDIKKSLPITLQLAGRFTRNNTTLNLGEATFIANTGDIKVTEELEDLYSHDPDWNYILQSKSEGQIKEEIDFKNFISNFSGFKNSKIPLQNLFPAMSTVIYKNHTDDFTFKKFKEGLVGFKEDDFIKDIYNSESKTLVLVTGQKKAIEWGKIKDIYDTIWNLFVIYYDENLKLLFINCSDNSSTYPKLAYSIIGENAELITGVNVFRSLGGIKRLKLQNVGLREILAKLIRYTQRTGTDIEQALSDAELNQAQKAVIFGVGFENGVKTSIGCSYKGRIWSKQKCNLKTLTEWCSEIGDKILDESIDPDDILKNTLTPIAISERPHEYPICIDWNDELYDDNENRYIFESNGRKIPLYLMDIELINPTKDGALLFALKSDDFYAELEMILFKKDKFPDFTFVFKDGKQKVQVSYGKKTRDVKEFFYDFPPTFWFINGSALSGIEFFNIKSIPPPFDSNKIVPRNWTGVDFKKEAQGVNPKITDSIQYNLLQELKQQDYDIIYDDDGSGEIADIITVKKFDKFFKVELYHLKYSINGKIGKDLRDLYTICGQAQKSVNWKLKEGKEFFHRLLKREVKTKNDVSCSRIEIGSKQTLIKFARMASKNFYIEWKIFIVQPSISKTDLSSQQLELLAVTEKYLKDRAEISLGVIGSA